MAGALRLLVDGKSRAKMGQIFEDVKPDDDRKPARDA